VIPKAKAIEGELIRTSRIYPGESQYPDDRALALDMAAAINAEIRDLFAAGADIVQIDEPYLQTRPEQARAYGVEVINRALEGVAGGAI
jgi:5-methyltetrahydropteroyltriglutamate--homocysteine methyltransferase